MTQAKTIAPARQAATPPVAVVMLSAGEAAKALSLSVRTLRRSVKNGTLPGPVRHGGRSLWYLDRLQKWAAARDEEVNGPMPGAGGAT